MEPEQYEQFEYARRRIRQKKYLYYHFVLFLLGSLFVFIGNHFMKIGDPVQWYKWVISIWLFLFILHFIKVFITDRFMNKNWEKEQIAKLMAKQQKKITQLESKIQDETSTP